MTATCAGRRAPAAVSGFLDFAGEHAVLVAHNARFDLAFLDREVELISGRRLAAPVVDTVGLARRLLAGRIPRVGLASLAQFFGTSVRPCHRALPDAQATAEILVSLIGLAQERGARTVADLVELSAPRRRRVYDKRSLVFGAPTRPGVYVFRGRAASRSTWGGRGTASAAAVVLSLGAAAARGRSGARGRRPGRVDGAGLRGGGRARGASSHPRATAAGERPREARRARVLPQPRGDRLVVSSQPGPFGPIRSRRRAERAARALDGATEDELERLTAGGPLPRLRARLRDLSECLRYEDAGRLRDRIRALESVIRELAALERLRAAEICLLTPASRPGFTRAIFVSGGRVADARGSRRAPEQRSKCAPGCGDTGRRAVARGRGRGGAAAPRLVPAAAAARARGRSPRRAAILAALPQPPRQVA